MKIAYFACNFPPILGGIGTACHYTANEIGKSHDVTIFLADRNVDYLKGNYKIKLFKPWFSYGYANFVPQTFNLVRDFDIVHLYYPYFGVAEFLFLRKLLGKKTPRIIFHQEMDMVGEGITKIVNDIHKKIILNWMLKKIDRIFVLSEDYAQNSDFKKIFKQSPEKFRVLPNGVDTQKFIPQETAPKTSREFVVFTAQGLDKQHFFKGIDILIKAISILIQNYKLPIKLVIAGDGNLKKDYQNMAQDLDILDKVEFLGSIEHDKLPKYYNLAQVTAVPSTQKTESFSITAAESMACGTPVLVSDWPGLRATIQDQVTGLIVKPSDEKNLAEKIKYLYEHPQKLEEMSKNSRHRAVKKYDWQIIAQSALNYYQELCP